MITITPKDALRAKSLPPGWQICIVTEHSIKPSSKDTSSNVHYYEIVVDEGQYKGVPLNEYTISDKAIGMGKQFFLACGIPQELWDKAEAGENVKFDEKFPIGKRLKVFVKPQDFQGRMLNKADSFMPVD